MKRIYISGPMTGLPECNFPAFHAAAAALRAKDFDVANPAEINAQTDGDWHTYLRADIKALCDCDALALLPGWESSKGAHLELHIAHRLGLEIGTVAEFVGQRHIEAPPALQPMTPAQADHLVIQFHRTRQFHGNEPIDIIRAVEAFHRIGGPG